MSFRNIVQSALLCLLAVCASSMGGTLDKGYVVGVYYFPGWKLAPPFAKAPPWDAIRKYGDRQPLLGWYEEGSVDVATKQLAWMRKYGIDLVIYDWYWTDKDGPALTQAIDAYLQSPRRHDVGFSILWANHTGTPSSLQQFDAIVDYWISTYFKRDSYYRIDGRPVVFIFSPDELEQKAKALGVDVPYLFARAREKATNAGLRGIYFVGATQATNDLVRKRLPAASYDAISAYNYHLGLQGRYSKDMPLSHSYRELMNGYQESWEWILKNSPLPYFVPVTSGWDKRPWGGSPDKLHDNSYSTADEFGEHLADAKAWLDRYPEKTRRTVVICCWNEYGEGSYIEPTVEKQFDYLERIKNTFRTK
ncbi:Lipopolysaccharide biosynthesis protein-like protein [Burkholderia multivorans]